MKEVTIVIPNYNGKKYLSDCLKALGEQVADTPEFTVVVVDNGSTDGSEVELVQDWPEVEHILLKENTGFCHAVNVGIQAARTPYIILLNNDTKVKPEFVKYLYEAIKDRQGAFSVSAKMLMWDRPELVDDAGDRYCILGWGYARGKGKAAAKYNKAVEVFSTCAGAAIYRKEILDKIGLFDEVHFAYMEDMDIGYRARIHGYHSFYEPRAEVLHFGSASTGSRYNERKTILASANNIYVVYKNMPLLQIILNFPFLFLGFLVKFLFFCKKRMGMLYLKGLRQGLKKSCSKEGRVRKVAFRWKNLKNYLCIQGQLYLNTVRILMKS